MPAELPWSEVLRRRNGLPPTDPEIEQLPAVAELTDGLVRLHDALKPVAKAYGDFLHNVARAMQATTRTNFALAPEPRCDRTDLPTTMCHHCKETHDA